MKKYIIGLFVLLLSFFITGCGCEKQTFNVTFDTDGGSEVKTQILNKGDVIVEPSIPEKDGYTFEGWYYNSIKFDFSTKVTEDITLEARWTKVVSSEITDNKNKTEEVNFTLSKTKITLNVGKNTTIKVTTDSDKKITWKSSNEKVVIVKDGKITAKAVGKAVVTVTIDGISKRINVTVVNGSSAKTTTTKKIEHTTTKKIEETTTKADVLHYILEKNKASKVGQAVLYLTKNGEKVSGTCTITTKTGEVVENVSIDVTGYVTNISLIKSVTNIKVK